MTELLSITANQNRCILTGRVDAVNEDSLDVWIFETEETIEGVQFQYHCDGESSVDNEKATIAFAEEDLIYVLYHGEADTPAGAANFKVLGFQDGVPRSCCVCKRKDRFCEYVQDFSPEPIDDSPVLGAGPNWVDAYRATGGAASAYMLKKVSYGSGGYNIVSAYLRHAWSCEIKMELHVYYWWLWEQPGFFANFHVAAYMYDTGIVAKDNIVAPFTYVVDHGYVRVYPNTTSKVRLWRGEKDGHWVWRKSSIDYRFSWPDGDDDDFGDWDDGDWGDDFGGEDRGGDNSSIYTFQFSEYIGNTTENQGFALNYLWIEGGPVGRGGCPFVLPLTDATLEEEIAAS